MPVYGRKRGRESEKDSKIRSKEKEREHDERNCKKVLEVKVKRKGKVEKENVRTPKFKYANGEISGKKENNFSSEEAPLR